MGNAVVHFEVGAADDGLLVAFYAELFDWGLQGLSGGDYTQIDTRGGLGINGGIGKSRTGEPWSTFYSRDGRSAGDARQSDHARRYHRHAGH